MRTVRVFLGKNGPCRDCLCTEYRVLLHKGRRRWGQQEQSARESGSGAVFGSMLEPVLQEEVKTLPRCVTVVRWYYGPAHESASAVASGSEAGQLEDRHSCRLSPSLCPFFQIHLASSIWYLQGFWAWPE